MVNCWQLLTICCHARSFDEVYYVPGNVHDPDALNRAHAEAATSAVLLLPWAGHGSSPSQQDHSEEMVDAYVLAATRSLRGLNPNMQVNSTVMHTMTTNNDICCLSMIAVSRFVVDNPAELLLALWTAHGHASML